MIEKLQEEILSMTVKKELLSSATEKVNHRHQEQLEQIACQQREIEAKISEYAVLAPTSKGRHVLYILYILYPSIIRKCKNFLRMISQGALTS